MQMKTQNIFDEEISPDFLLNIHETKDMEKQEVILYENLRIQN